MSEKKYMFSRFAKSLDITDDGDFGYFKGYAITWDNIDRIGDVAVKGCFEETLKDEKKKIVMNWQHNYDETIGSYPVIKEDDKGLYVEGRINLGTARGKEAYALLKAGDIDGLSIGYSIAEDGFDIRDGIRYLTKLDLYEISLVSTPCNPQALVDSVKSNSLVTVDDIKACNGDPRKLEKTLCDKGFSRSAATIVASALAKSVSNQRETEKKLLDLKRRKLELLNEKKADLEKQLNKGN